MLSNPRFAIKLFSLLTTKSTAAPNNISGAISNNLLIVEYMLDLIIFHFHGFAYFRNLLNEYSDRLNTKHKKEVLEAIANFNAFGESIYTKSNLKEVVKSISELCENATKLALQDDYKPFKWTKKS